MTEPRPLDDLVAGLASLAGLATLAYVLARAAARGVSDALR